MTKVDEFFNWLEINRPRSHLIGYAVMIAFAFVVALLSAII